MQKMIQGAKIIEFRGELPKTDGERSEPEPGKRQRKSMTTLLGVNTSLRVMDCASTKLFHEPERNGGLIGQWCRQEHPVRLITGF
jgi:hypothetical protein